MKTEKRTAVGTSKSPRNCGKRRGRPPLYSEHLAFEICIRLAGGESLVRICEKGEMPARRTIMTWLSRGDSGEQPYANFLKQYLGAKSLQQDIILDDAIDIADDSRWDWVERIVDGQKVYVPDNDVIKRARMRIDARFRVAERMAPKKYGVKAHLNHSGEVTDPVAAIVGRVTFNQSKQPDERVEACEYPHSPRTRARARAHNMGF